MTGTYLGTGCHKPPRKYVGRYGESGPFANWNRTPPKMHRTSHIDEAKYSVVTLCGVELKVLITGVRNVDTRPKASELCTKCERLASQAVEVELGDHVTLNQGEVHWEVVDVSKKRGILTLKSGKTGRTRRDVPIASVTIHTKHDGSKP